MKHLYFWNIIQNYLCIYLTFFFYRKYDTPGWVFFVLQCYLFDRADLVMEVGSLPRELPAVPHQGSKSEQRMSSYIYLFKGLQTIESIRVLANISIKNYRNFFFSKVCFILLFVIYNCLVN